MIVPTVDLGLCDVAFCSIAIAGDKPSIKSTSGFSIIWRNCRANDDVLDIPKLRDELDTSRKYLIPLLEHVDDLGLTRLRDGVRVLLPSSPAAQAVAASLESRQSD